MQQATGYTLLTGATGLLGRYLMRDLLLRERPLAVLVRPNRLTPHERIDGVLAEWEAELGRALPRPVVLSGDISETGVGLDKDAMRWLQRNCHSVIHSAASLTFYEDGDEPWRSNVEGTRQLLDVCRRANIGVFNHVSSAYVCGQRTGLVREDELDVGQEFGNDYERSKVQAEQLVRQAEFLDACMILRPSIIVGDSRSGFSLTFHGFYTPLRLICAVLSQVDHKSLFSTNLVATLGLEGHEENFVPVDWVSAAMVTLLERQTPDGRAYAFVTPNPVSIERIVATFERVTAEMTRRGSAMPTPERHTDSNRFFEGYEQQFAVYRSYFRNDPTFDSTRTNAVIPDVPCPVLDDKTLDMLARVAIQQRFAWNPPWGRSNQPDTRQWMRHLANGAGEHGDGSCGSCTDAFELTVSGAGGGCWTIANKDVPHADVGHSNLSCIVRLNSTTFADLVRGDLSLDRALKTGRLVIAGGDPTRDRLQETLQYLRRIGSASAD